jgi:hypothetical protein
MKVVVVNDIEASPVVTAQQLPPTEGSGATEVKDVTVFHELGNINDELAASVHSMGVLNVYRTHEYAPNNVCHDRNLWIIPAWLCTGAFGGILYYLVINKK